VPKSINLNVKAMKLDSISRRNFITKTVATAGISALGVQGFAKSSSTQQIQHSRLPREVWIATVSQMGLRAEDPSGMVKLITSILEDAIVYKPDVVCFPELFGTSSINKNLNLKEKVDSSQMILDKFSTFAKKNDCYIICPVYTKTKGRVYNSAVVIDRLGEEVGTYHKIHITENELALGLIPGPLNPPVFKTDFGVIGVQICYDMLWDDGWNALMQKGAEIVFWPSAYAGGLAVNTKAWRNNYVVVSSTWKNTTKICDIAGDVIAQTGTWDTNLVCAPVNLEKAFLHSWPSVQKFDAIRNKYGRKVKITNYDEEEWSVIESLSPEILVKNILSEFDLETINRKIINVENAQNKARRNS